MIIAIFSLISLILLIFLLGIFTFIKNKNNFCNLYFFVFTVFLDFWICLLFFENKVKDLFITSILLKTDYFLALFVVLFLMLFCINFSTQQKKQINLIVFSLPIFLLTALLPTELIIKNISINGMELNYNPGSLYILYIIYIVGYMCLGIINLLRKLLKAQGSAKNQILYVFLGFLFSSLIVVIFDVILQPLIKNSAILSQIGIWGILFFIIFTTYAITKTELFDIRIAISRTLAYGTSIFSVFLIGIAIFYLNLVLLNNSRLFLFFAFPIFGIFSAVIFEPIRNFVQTPLKEKWISLFYDTDKLLIKLSDQLAPFYERKPVLIETCKVMMQGIKLQDSFVFLFNQEENKITQKLETKVELIEIIKDENGSLIEVKNRIEATILNPFFTFIQSIKEPMFYSDLIPEAKAGFKEIGLNEKSLILPLSSTNQLEGIIVLGPKISEDSFYPKDLNFFKAVIKYLQVILDRLKPYEEIKAKYEKSFKLIGITETVTTINHEINSPLTALLMAGEELEKQHTPEEQNKLIKIINKASKSIEKIVQKLKSVNEPEEEEYFAGKKMLKLK